MLQNASSLSYFLKWIATEAEFCCKTGKVVLFATRACQHRNLQMGRNFKDDDNDDNDYYDVDRLEFQKCGLSKRIGSQYKGKILSKFN